MVSLTSRKRMLVRYAVLFVALFVFMLCGGLFGVDGASREAEVYDAVCRQLAANTTEGRQALVSSVWWPPLPFLLRLPFQLVLESEQLPIASLAVSALFGAASLIFLLRILARWQVGHLRFALAAALALHPCYLRVCFDGSSGATAVYLVFLAAYGLGGWVDARKLRPLVYFAFALAMLAIVSPALALWGLGLFVLFLGDMLGRRFLPRQREGAIVLAVTPLLYTFGLWVLMNWLVMGDGLYFLRSLLTPGVAPPPRARLPGLTAVHLAAAVISASVFLVSVVRRDRQAAYIGLAAALPLPLAYVLNVRGLLWDPVPLLFVLFPLCIASCGALIAGGGLPPRVRQVALMLPMLLTPWSMVLSRGLVARAEQLERDRHKHMSSAVQQRTLARSEFSKVYVCGYDGFAFTDAGASSVFVHALDFNFYKAMQDYRGHSLFILLHAPTGRSAMDSIHWKFDGMYSFGSRGTLYDADFGAWRLYEIFQPPE